MATRESDVFRCLDDEGRAVGEAPDPTWLKTAALPSMARARALGERAERWVGEGELPLYPTSLGREAVGVGASAVLQAEDWLFPTARDAAAVLARGVQLSELCAQMWACGADGSRGRRLPGFYADRSRRIAAPSAMVGAHLPHAVGAAWGARITDRDEVGVALFDGPETRSAGFHNALNFAGVFRLPVVFVGRSADDDGIQLEEKAEAYGLGVLRCDGNDVVAVMRTVERACKRARGGDGAVVVEARVTALEAERGRAFDPLRRVERWLLATGEATDTELAELRAAAAHEVEEAAETARRAPAPAGPTLFEDVYAHLPSHLRRQAAELLERR